MAVTVTDYELSPGWTNQDFADAMRDAYVGSGLGTEGTNCSIWDDGTNIRFAYTSRHGGSGAYEEDTIFFHQYSTNIYAGRALFFDHATSTVTGTAYLDHSYGTTNNSLNNELTSATVSTATNAIIRTTVSGDQTDFVLFQFLQGTNTNATWFHIPDSLTPQSWWSFDKHSVASTYFLGRWSYSYAMHAYWHQKPQVRRDIQTSTAFKGETTTTYFGDYLHYPSYAYAVLGNASNTTSNYYSLSGSRSHPLSNVQPFPCIVLPYDDPTNNPAYATNAQPICTGLPYTPYFQGGVLPNDIGFVGRYNNTLGLNDQFIVSAGVEEWTVASPCQNTTGTNYASILLVVRTT